MALTVPTIPTSITQCSVTVSAVDSGFSVPIVLTSTQVADWTDQELTDRTNALKAAVEAFLPAGQTIQVNVTWMQQGFDTTVNTSELVQ